MTHIMIDLETMGTEPNAAIIALGAVVMDFKNQKIGACYYNTIDLASSVKAGGTMNPSTVLWWMQQSEEARKIFSFPGLPLETALICFSMWVKEQSENSSVCIWGYGASFDNVVLRSAYSYCGLPCPWGFRSDRCYRTEAAIHPDILPVDVGIAHNALDDATAQAYHLMKILGTKYE